MSHCGDSYSILVENVLRCIQQKTEAECIKIYCLPELKEAVTAAIENFKYNLTVNVILAKEGPYASTCDICCRLAGERVMLP